MNPHLSTTPGTAGIARRREQALLVACARMAGDEQTVAEVTALIRPDLDWDYLIALAREHAMIPLLALAVLRSPAGVAPDEIRSRLKTGTFVNAQHNLWMTREMILVIEQLDAAGISCVPYKGPLLAIAAYGDLKWRQFSDLDLLVRREDAVRARDHLRSQGFRLALEASQYVSLESKKDYKLIRDSDGLTIELHWSIAPAPFGLPLDLERFHHRLERVTIARREIQALAPENLLLVLCVHGSKHMWSRIAWISDVAGLINAHPALDWDGVAREAAGLRIERIVALGLRLALEIGGARIPVEVLRRFPKDRAVERLAAEVATRFFGTPAASASVDLLSFQMNLRERASDRFRLAWGFTARMVTPTEQDRQRLPLPLSLSFLHYLYRPFRLVAVYGARPFQTFIKSVLLAR